MKLVINEASSETRGSARTDSYLLKITYLGRCVFEEDGRDDIKTYHPGGWEKKLNQLYLELFTRKKIPGKKVKINLPANIF
ncbi:MAG TPA: hypothetical protein VJH68_03960 [Candidatus Nanoarchaeia archaeon]|nr:hypothetical protein [Candidatus Nanoarchaeia archaeon]